MPAVNSTVHIYPINGACHRVAPDATAFAYRDATFATVIAGMWPDPADNEANIEWVRDYYDATAPLSEEGGYINFMAEDDQEPDQGQLQGQLRPPGRRQAEVRPGQPVPPEPEHQAVARSQAAAAECHGQQLAFLGAVQHDPGAVPEVDRVADLPAHDRRTRAEPEEDAPFW